MVSRGSVRNLLATAGAILWLLVFTAGATLAGDSDCDVSVDPLAAAGGSVFVFSGTGYTPTELLLQKEGDAPISHDLNVGDADPWEVTVRSRVGDEGRWTATFTDSVAGCSAMVEFRVTLSNTDALDDIVAATTESGSAPLGLYLAVVVLGFSGGMLLGRRVHARDRA